ncbi:MAG: DUF2764 family protein [Candidatus Omnitrophota bacterium]
MINKYYYLVASLPYLKLETAVPITREEFLSECAKWLDGKSYQTLASIDAKEPGAKMNDNEVVKSWKAFDRDFRGELAKVRRAKREGARESIPMQLKDIFEEHTPLLMEKRIEEKRWDFLDEKEFGYHFDIYALSLYYLKLQILERLSAFNKERGGKAFEELCEVRYE